MKERVGKSPVRGSGEHGFTLIEMVIGMCVFAIGVLVIITMQMRSVQGNADSMKITEATMWAVNQSEQFMDQAYDSSDLRVGAHGPVPAGNPLYSLSWEVTETTPNTKEVAITVHWASGRGNHNLTFNYLKALL